jgi:hypothetical protein
MTERGLVRYGRFIPELAHAVILPAHGQADVGVRFLLQPGACHGRSTLQQLAALHESSEHRPCVRRGSPAAARIDSLVTRRRLRSMEKMLDRGVNSALR